MRQRMELVRLNQRRCVREHRTEVVVTDVILLAHVCGRHAPCQAPKDTCHRDTRATDHRLAVLKSPDQSHYGHAP